ncbi:uncharacterized protein F5891DRAFT_1186917 [Suillus fuscotomentosus]|uniref:Uncharacterized protein n=1 Tax=Suillus fuscotomentosus TaxID=1912939 RepID=A0AAD4EBF7_9AGAM|nr:uncharacterized protein F5891DRAFT_1186917 [Suillus fuscotomentosus]KAG1901894.1 hypothetical protein F5891DRAFT_1186917 [Suillus fuscotomentosus]
MAKQPIRRTLLFPMDLGSLVQYQRSVFPISRVQRKGLIGEVDFFLESTLDEIFRMRNFVGNTKNFQLLIKNATTRYDDLMIDKQEIEQQRKSLNPVKKFSAYRSVRLLLSAGEVLYEDTKTISEKMRRGLLSIEVDREDVQSVMLDDDLPSNARISGIAIPLDSESQPAEITASYYDAAIKFAASQKNTYGKDPFADEYAVENSQANAEHRHSSTTGSAMATSDGGAASSSSRLSGASGNDFSFQNSDVAPISTI